MSEAQTTRHGSEKNQALNKGLVAGLCIAWYWLFHDAKYFA
jgi:hypothetical protein